ncbi:MAG: class I mannose-6-phosphate isomerase [Actinomycetota bacterium]
MTTPSPMLLPVNQFDHFYRGGDRIGALRQGPGGPQRPEEWLGSTTTRFGDPVQGLSVLPNGRYLRDAVIADPVAWLGPAHVDRYGTSVEVLVKFLDLGQRLPVHLHPNREFARTHLGLAHGKTEAWYVLDAPPGARVGVGFAESMALADVAAMVAAHDSQGLLDSLRTREVRAGDAMLVPAGLPHTVQEGVFVLELQEPTDLSILLEWQDFAVDGDRDGHLGLGFDVALQAVDTSAVSDSDLDRLVVRREDIARAGLTSALPREADAYFRAQHLDTSDAPVTVDAGFAVVAVLDGAGTITTPTETLAVSRGDVLVLPHAAGDWIADGALVAVACRPPAPDAPTGAR